jgi:hypothetical protein
MDVATLVTLAGNTFVTAAATDAWEDVRRKVARLFGRGSADPLIEGRLDATRAQLEAAPPADLEKAQAEQAARWAGRLADLLEDHPDAEDELRSLVAEIQRRLLGAAVTATGNSVAAGGDINVTADQGSLAVGVIHGDVTWPGPPSPGRASG